MHPLPSRPGPEMRSGSAEIVGSGPIAGGPRRQVKAGVRRMGLRKARPSFPTPWSNVERCEGYCPVRRRGRRRRWRRMRAVNLGGAGTWCSGPAQNESCGRARTVQRGTSRLGHVCEIELNESQTDEALEVGGQARSRQSRQSVRGSCSCSFALCVRVRVRLCVPVSVWGCPVLSYSSLLIPG